MIGTMEKLSSSLNEDNVVSYYDKLCYVVNNKYKYHLYVLNKKEYKCIKSLQKSRFILQPDSEYFLNNQYYFKYNLSNHSSEKNAIAIVAKDLFINIFNEYCYEMVIKKDVSLKFNYVFKVLDSKFSYLELRIREIEMMPIKDDVCWIILSQYHTLLDTRIYLYDLQADIFKYIEKTEATKYGLIFKNMFGNCIKDRKFEGWYSCYYGPISALYIRMALIYGEYIYDELKELLKHESKLQQKYFCFMMLYIFTISISLEQILKFNDISCYLGYIKKIDSFINKFKDFLK